MRSLIRRAPTLTRRGWALAVGAIALAAAGRILGLFELFVFAAACGGLVVAAFVAVVARPVRLEAVRRLHPPRIHAGTDTRVELVVRNAGRRTSPVVSVRDSFEGGPAWRGAARVRERARFLVAPLRAGEDEHASYRLFAERRGRYALGPLEIDRGDAFGLVSSVGVIAPVTELVVYPAVDAISAPPPSRGSITSGTYLPTAVGSSGDEFYGLREYQVGDDMRRVHWPSTARLDELIVRQLELPWEGRATVLLDTRVSSHDDASIEVAVSAAASIVVACAAKGSSVRVVSTDGFDSGSAKGLDHLDLMLAYLAIAHPKAPRVSVPAPSTSPTRGEDILVTTSAAALDDLLPMAGSRRQQDRLTLVVVDRPGFEPRTPRQGGTAVAGATVVRVSASVPMAAAWARAMTKSLAGRPTGGPHRGGRP